MMLSHNHFIAGNAANHIRNCREAVRLSEQKERELITVYDDGVPVPGDTANPFNTIQEAETAAERYENALWLVWFRIRRACRRAFCREVSTRQDRNRSAICSSQAEARETAESAGRRDTLRRMYMFHHQMLF